MVAFTPILLGFIGIVQVLLGMMFSAITFGVGGIFAVPLILLFWFGTLMYLYFFCSGLNWYNFIPGLNYPILIWKGIWDDCEEKDINWMQVAMYGGGAVLLVILLVFALRFMRSGGGTAGNQVSYTYPANYYSQSAYPQQYDYSQTYAQTQY